jgi:hypothetical protein
VRSFSVLVTVILVFCPLTDAGVTLPLNGACRAGRFFPVTIDGLDHARLSASGCIPVDVDTDGRRLTVPVLVTGVPGPLSFGTGTAELHLIPDDERLVGTTDPASSAAGLFPDQHVTTIPLDPADPLPGDPAAWETLDAVVLDPPAISRLNDATRSTLLAAGVEIAATGDARPDGRWPWVRQGPWWRLRYRPAGPNSELLNADAYSPVSVWSPPRPAGGLVSIAALMSLAVIAVCLWRSRWRLPVAIAILLLATGGTAWWRRGLDVVATGGGDVLVVDGPLVQRDIWEFQRGLDSGEVTVPFHGWTHPVFSGAAAMTAANLRLTVTPSVIAFHASARPQGLLAFVHREVSPGALPPVVPDTTSSPMQDIAKAMYAPFGSRLAGDGPTAPGRWATAVVVRR